MSVCLMTLPFARRLGVRIRASDGRRVASGAQCCAKRVMPTGICVECGNEKDKIHFGTNEWKRKATRVCTDCVGARAKPTDLQMANRQHNIT